MPSPLSGGRRRRRRLPRLLTLLAVLLAPAAVGAAVYVSFFSGDDSTTVPGLPRASGASAHVHRVVHRPPTVNGKPVPKIRLAGVDAFHLQLRKPPRAGLVFDVDNGEALWRLRPARVLPIASLTKIMTALIVVQETRPGERVRITQAALDYTGSGVGILPKGKRVRLETLLNGMLVVSGNDAAIALAVHISGTERRFVRLMNRRARRWGLTCTHFASSDGLETADRSCPRDLAILTRLAMSEPRIRRIVRQRSVVLPFPVKGGKLYLYGHNYLIRMGYRGAIGLKTGYTDAAGRCFVGVAHRDGHRLAVVLLDSFDPGKQAPKLLDAAFAADRARG
jgi:serine-type D-Ala-D-Ala carboxypeptidase (penicillin-binding protein 5/6)